MRPFLAVVMSLSVGVVLANPASPEPFLLGQPDGSTFWAKVWGDEFLHGHETADGHTIVRDPASGFWEYAQLDGRGGLVASGLRPGLASPPGPRHRRPSRDGLLEGTGAATSVPPRDGSAGTPQSATSGVVNSLVIMVQFPADEADPDGSQPAVPCTYGAVTMYANLFGSGLNPPGENMTDYFRQVSYGKLDLRGQAVGCFTVANDKNDYHDGPLGAGELVSEAVRLADPTVDFAPFDQDGDGWVEHVAVVYAGCGPDNGCYQGGDAGQLRGALWPHQGGLPEPVEVDGGARRVFRYYLVPELLWGTGIRSIGVFAHEFGHVLGLPDLYDTDLSSAGIGMWGLMGAGSWNGNGRLPAHPVAWSKWRLGWIEPKDLTGQNVAASVKSATTHPFAIRLLANPNGPADWPGGSGEYFLLENRTWTGFDRGLPGCGVLVWHIDEAMFGNWAEGHAEASHRLVDLEEAGVPDHLDTGDDVRGRSDDPFPARNNVEFSDATSPAARLYDGSPSGVRVRFLASSSTCADTLPIVIGTDVCRTFDVNGDQRLDAVELGWLGAAWPVCEPEPAETWWRPIDLNHDDCVDGDDLAILGSEGVWGHDIESCRY